MSCDSLKAAIKSVMKKKGLTYSDLADHLGVSYATVKRILTSEDLSLNRLLKICAWLNLNLTELEAIAEAQRAAVEPKFTEAQELFLAADPRYFVYLLMLYDGISPEEIADRYKLDRKSTQKYLLRLEQHQLIHVTGKGAVRCSFSEPPRWISRGPLAQTHYERLMSTFLNFFIESAAELFRSDSEDKKIMRSNVSCAPMSKKNHDAMVEEIEGLLRKWEHTRSIERKVHGEDELGHQVLLWSTAWRENKSEVTKLENVFGDVDRL